MVACYAAPPTQMPAAKDHALLKQPNCLILRDCPESPPRGWREATPPKQAVNRDRTFHSCTGNRPDVSSSDILVVHPRRAGDGSFVHALIRLSRDRFTSSLTVLPVHPLPFAFINSRRRLRRQLAQLHRRRDRLSAL
ncbi:hypothetical protein M408DRAFT_91026 [Serendipita vermifera MAFF 305830]|uniref:Uncharacterized protein n=1 Tax=Serendipita vermifera MAFF 305830 TaxID=933852 RepID=A0A0C3BPY9_SERVB|nr:hypothetical protein M408DRAFT_91026 [Serendipita vermifera MAFF 305830]